MICFCWGPNSSLVSKKEQKSSDFLLAHPLVVVQSRGFLEITGSGDCMEFRSLSQATMRASRSTSFVLIATQPHPERDSELSCFFWGNQS